MASSSKCCKDQIPSECNALPEETVLLYESISVKNPYEAFTVLFHSFMLEKGFIPKDVAENEKFQILPKNWNTKELYKIVYRHFCCPEYTCSMTCIPLYGVLSIRGIVCDEDCSESVTMKIEMLKYSKSVQNFRDMQEFFQDLQDLSICFKDGFCLPLLNLLHEVVGSTTLFGMLGIVDEMKIYLMKFLPVGDVLSLSVANRRFNSLANSPHLWKFLFVRDFAAGGVQDVESSSEVDWKQKYKAEYLKKKRRPEPRVCLYYPYILDPNNDIEMGFPAYHDPFQPMPYIFPMIPRMPPYFRRL